MRVKIWSETDEAPHREADLSECLPDRTEYRATLRTLKQDGRCWIGGGSAPLILLTRIEP